MGAIQRCGSNPMNLAKMTGGGLMSAKMRRLVHQETLMKAVLAGTNWVDVANPSGLRGCSGQSGTEMLMALLARRRLFALEVAGHQLVPGYAFTFYGEAFPVIAEVIKCFGDASSIRLAAWFESTSSFLDGRRPRELLHEQPDAVLAAVREHLKGPMHG